MPLASNAASAGRRVRLRRRTTDAPASIGPSAQASNAAHAAVSETSIPSHTVLSDACGTRAPSVLLQPADLWPADRPIVLQTSPAVTPVAVTPGPGASRTAACNVLRSVPIPSIEMDTVAPSLIDPTPTDVPHAITSPGSSVRSCEMRLTCSAGENTMSDSG